MEILIKAKTENAGEFKIIFEDHDNVRKYFFEILKRLQFSELQRAINNDSPLFAEISKHYYTQFKQLEKCCFYGDYDNLIISDYKEKNVFKFYLTMSKGGQNETYNI